MKKLNIVIISILMLPLMAKSSCDSVRANISKKIIKNGVPEKDFILNIVPKDQVEEVGDQVVGHCENNTQKIIYKKIVRSRTVQ